MKVALVQDWLTELGGAEKVFKELYTCYPDADIYTLVYNDKILKELGIKKGQVTSSFIQKLPFGKKYYRYYLPYFTKAIESFDLTSYDLIISSSYSVAKGVLSQGQQTHICYCHSPVRYAWDLYHEYLDTSNLHWGPKAWLLKRELRKLRTWDIISTNRVDHFISNSDFIKTRIGKIYRRNAETIYPPVEINKFDLEEDKADYFITCSRMVPYKKIDLIVKAFAKLPHLKLKVIGTGPEFKKIKALATSNVDLMGFQPDEVLQKEMAKAQAFIFAAKEDFGIVPVEAQACGTPVIAYGKGGALETVIDGVTGCFFYEQTEEAIIEAILNLVRIKDTLNPQIIRNNALKFDVPEFHKKFNKLVANISSPISHKTY